MEVRDGGNLGPSLGRKECFNTARLVFSYFEKNPSAGTEGRRGNEDETTDEVESIGAAIESGDGVVEDFRGEGGDFLGGDVGEVRHDGVIGWAVCGEEVALLKIGVRTESDGIGAREIESGGVEIPGVNFPGRTFEGEREGDDSRACADIGEGERFLFGEGFEDFEDELFGFGAGDERAGVNVKGASVEVPFPEEVLEGFAGSSASDKLAQGRAFGF